MDIEQAIKALETLATRMRLPVFHWLKSNRTTTDCQLSLLPYMAKSGLIAGLIAFGILLVQGEFVAWVILGSLTKSG